MATTQTTKVIVGVTARPEVHLEDAEGVEEARNHPQGESVRVAAWTARKLVQPSSDDDVKPSNADLAGAFYEEFQIKKKGVCKVACGIPTCADGCQISLNIQQ